MPAVYDSVALPITGKGFSSQNPCGLVMLLLSTVSWVGGLSYR